MKNLSILFISLTIFIYSCSSNDDTSTPPSVVQTTDPESETPQYTLTVSSEDGGSVSTEGGKYDEGTTITITATPKYGYVFTGWSDGSTDNSISIEVNQNITITAYFAPNIKVINVGNNKLSIDLSNIPDGDNFKLITQVVSSTGNVKLYFENVIDRVNNPVLCQTKLIKWSGTNDSLKNPILVEPNNQIIKPIVGNLYNYLDEEYDIPFIYSWSKQMNITHNKPMGWEGNFLDYEGDGTPDLFALRNNNDGTKDFVVVGYNPTNRNYSLKKEVDLIESLNFDPTDSLNTGNSIVGDFNNDNDLDFFGNAHGEWYANSTAQNLYFSGPMFAFFSDGMGNYSSTIIDEEKYLRFPGSLKTVDWNMDGNLDVFASMPYAIYLNNGDNTFTKIDISESIQPQLDWLSIAFEDLNSDGHIDIVGANFNMQISRGFGMEIYYGKPDGSFEYETVYHPLYNQLWNGSDDLTIIDVDGDGFKEILTYNMTESHIDLGRDYDESEMREFKSTGNGYSLNTESNYNLTIKTAGGSSSNSTTAWDYDGDGDLDIFLQSDDDTRNFSVHELFDEIPMGSPYNQFLKIEYIDIEDFNNNNSYITGFFFENENGVLVKRYFNELYSD